MAVHHSQRTSTFDLTFTFAAERIRTRQQEARTDRLAARSMVVASDPLRVRLGTLLIGVGSSMVTPAASRRPSLTD